MAWVTWKRATASSPSWAWMSTVVVPAIHVNLSQPSLIMEYDALIIGAGPSGSSAAAILAEYGHRVLILEREKFPRYHIGESLIPFTYGPLERLGLIPKMKKSHFQKKYRVVFVQPDGKRSQPF